MLPSLIVVSALSAGTVCFGSLREGVYFDDPHQDETKDFMNLLTLDALMMIATNRPDLGDKNAIKKLIDGAFEHWKTTQKRCLARSQPGVSKPRNNKRTVPFHDLLEEQERTARLKKAGNLSGLVDLDDELGPANEEKEAAPND